MGITPLGKELRHMRIEKGERLVDMAVKLNISAAFLSAVETERKSAPEGFDERIIDAYKIFGEEADRVRSAYDRSLTSVRIIPDNPLARDATALLARKINELPQETLEELRRLLLREGGKDDG